MESSWQATTLGAVTSWYSGGTPKKDEPRYWSGEIPWISATSMHGTRFSDSDLRLTETGLQNGSRLAAKGSVLLLVRGGALHKRIPVGIAVRDVAFNQDVKALIPRADKIRPWYLLFWLMALENTLLESVVEYTGIGAGKLDTKRMQALPIHLPQLHEQDAIVATLKSIDDRIHLFHKSNASLEAIAQAVFKSWFIDFDPVRAKAEAREPEGMEATTAGLFPSEFEESDLGRIPKGWRIDEIGNVVPCVGGATPSTKEPLYWNDPIHHWVTPKDLSGLQAPVLIDTERKVSDSGLAKISSGLLPVGTVLLSSRAPIGYLAIAHVPTAINQGFIAMLPGGELPPTFLLPWTQLNLDEIKQKANGSTFMEISKSAFRPIKLVIPPAEVVDAFSSVVKPLMDRIAENERQRRVLAQLRDTLLPRLISGKLRVMESDAPIEDGEA